MCTGGTELSIPTTASSDNNAAAILHIGSVTVEFFEHTSPELISSILKAVQSCQTTFRMSKKSISVQDISVFHYHYQLFKNIHIKQLKYSPSISYNNSFLL